MKHATFNVKPSLSLVYDSSLRATGVIPGKAGLFRVSQKTCLPHFDSTLSVKKQGMRSKSGTSESTRQVVLL